MYEKYRTLETNKKTATFILIAEVLVTYAVFSLMLETGNLAYYALFILFGLDSVRRLINLFKKSKTKENAKNTKSKSTA